MKIIRSILGVISGYAIFAISAILLFKLSEIDPHNNPSIGFMLITIAYGIIFSFIGGIITQLIAGSENLTINYMLAGIMAVFAAFSLFKTSGNHFTQLGAILLFAPASILGGLTYLKKVKK